MPTTVAEIPRLTVAAGVLIDTKNRILIGQRVKQDGYQGQWEFPGGKLEPGETAAQALTRELREEIGIKVEQCQLFCTLKHRYPDRDVSLFVFLVERFRGQLQAQEGQALQWVYPRQLKQIAFLKGNQAIVELLLEHFAGSESDSL